MHTAFISQVLSRLSESEQLKLIDSVTVLNDKYKIGQCPQCRSSNITNTPLDNNDTFFCNECKATFSQESLLGKKKAYCSEISGADDIDVEKSGLKYQVARQTIVDWSDELDFMLLLNSGLIEDLISGLRKKITVQTPELLEKHPVDAFINYLIAFPGQSNYNEFSAKTLRVCSAIKRSFSSELQAGYYKIVLLKLLQKSINALSERNFPEKVKNVYIQTALNYFDNIVNDQYPNDWYDISNDKFCKAVALCSIRMIPVGPRWIIKGHISPRFLFLGGIRQLYDGIVFLGMKIRGIQPVYELHMNREDPVLMSNFSEAGWREMFFTLADMLQRDKTIRAVVGNGWLYDPQVFQISPKLGYHWMYAKSMGAKIYKLKSDHEAIHNALYKNKIRERLFEQGKYLPTNYMVIFPRKAILDWAELQR